MKRVLAGVMVVLVMMGFALAGLADDKDKVVYKQKTIIDFSDVTIQGELTKPEGSYISSRKESAFQRLIKVRENFYPELLKSVDKL